MHLKTFDSAFTLKDVDEKGTFTGYGSVFEVTDLQKEIVAAGAFTESLKVRKPAMLWQHKHSEIPGVFKEVKEDAVGLHMTGQILLKTPRGAEAYELMKADALGGMSIGGIVRDDSYDRVTGIRTLKRLDLWEVSLVTFPANESARFTEVKQLISEGELPTMKEFEYFLREAGFSKTQAAAIAGKGLASLVRSESGPDPKSDDDEWKAIAAALKSSKI
jgi:uncharacterized protein